MMLESDNNGNCHSLFGLSADTPQHEYRNSEHFLSKVNHELGRFTANPQSNSEYIIITGVNNETFDREFIRNGLFGFESYFPTLHVVLLKMESNAHAVTHGVFHEMLHDKLKEMNAHDLVLPHGAAHVKGEERLKRADESFKPKRRPVGRSNHWPSLVVEVGYSETRRKLKGDVEWWTTSSGGDVRSVITVAVDRNVKRITICQWDEAGQKTYEDVISQGINRKAIQHTNPTPLVIEFERLCLRLPSGMETDLSFTVPELEKFAITIWEVQFNY